MKPEKSYFLVWHYIANYGVARDWPGLSPEDAVKRWMDVSNADFRAKARVMAFESPPAYDHRPVSGGTRCKPT